ncbi:MAG: hypothetical protein ACOCRX_00155 [Candidatus Woesearchaeota archaeon]
MINLRSFFGKIRNISALDIFFLSLLILYIFLSVSNHNFLLVQAGENLPEDDARNFLSILESGDLSNVGFIEKYEDSFYDLSIELKLEQVFQSLFSVLLLLLIPFLCLIKTSIFFKKKVIFSNAIIFSIFTYLVLFIFSLPLNLFSRVYDVIEIDFFGLIFGLFSLFIFIYGFIYLTIYSLKLALLEEKSSMKEMFIDYFKDIFNNIKFKLLDFISFIGLSFFYLLILSLITPPESFILILIFLSLFIILFNILLYSYLSFRKSISF